METFSASPLYIGNRTDQIRAFGLIRFHSLIDAPDSQPMRAVVSAGGEEAVFHGAECFVPRSDEGGWRLDFNIVTHLFADGPLDIHVMIETADGVRHALPKRLVYVANDSQLAREVAQDLRAFGTVPIQSRIIDSMLFPYEDGHAGRWFDDADPGDVPLSFDCAPDREAAHRHLAQWGFCILPEKLDPITLQNFRGELETGIAEGTLPYEAGSSTRIHDAHHLEWGRKVWLYPPVMRFLEEHFRDTPCACQTLTYVHGSEQSGHQDTIHLTPYPAGFMCGVWIALEDVQPDSGELFIYPGSHRETRLRAAELQLPKVSDDYSSYAKFDAEVRRLVEEGGYERAVYRPSAGQILVWHENLAHGGSVRINREQTRLSIVSHYFAKGSVAYYDSRGEAAALEALPVAV